MLKKGKPEEITKGTPTAVLLSVLIHAALFLLAGMFVVFTVVKQKESYDHIVRDVEELGRIREYIRRNPEHAWKFIDEFRDRREARAYCSMALA